LYLNFHNFFYRNSNLGDSCAHEFVAMSRIFQYCWFSIYVLFGIPFYLFFVLLVSGRSYVDAVNHKNLQDLQEEDFEQ
jgi:hypothetical protein